ncbi:gamma-glutamyl phosphate reductase [Alphaproteobacteria bacterium]|nr:gamma-glutamyl phosphate reductase [Alphaproteobacteria bacterium]GHT90327.1 gamma-glutamyl phosphate reductase [Alphaproteobacteria bacterium]
MNILDQMEKVRGKDGEITEGMNIIHQLSCMKEAGRKVMELSDDTKNRFLEALSEKLVKCSDEIIRENAKDLALMSPDDPMYDRLLLDKSRIESMANDVQNVIALPSPVGLTLEHKTMPNGLIIDKVSVPLGVVAVIYESRPNVTIDVFALCFKSGNACVLKGGKEAHHSNTILVKIIRQLISHRYNMDQQIVYLMPPGRESTKLLLNAVGSVDVCIPRGSQSLIDFVRKNAQIPIIETGAGIVHTYFDLEGDVEKGAKIIKNAKTRRVSVCNALDCLIIHKNRLGDLHQLVEPLAESNVELYADEDAYAALEHHYAAHLLHHATKHDFGKEFLSYKMSIKTVGAIDEATNHIREYSSGHSEAIITESEFAAKYFIEKIDAAVVYVNASTAFTDGAQFGMGAEIGISTQKLHVRGPMSLEALTSYKWIVRGNGNIR